MKGLFINEDNVHGVIDITSEKSPAYYFKKHNISCISKNNIDVYYDDTSSYPQNTKASLFCGISINGCVIIVDTNKELKNDDYHTLFK